MRLIDADKIVFDYSGLVHISPDDFTGIAKYFADQIKEMPAIAPPPNNPLTLDELRNMDGVPVFIKSPGHLGYWALVQEASDGNIYFTASNGIGASAKIALRYGGKVYRRKPDEKMV